MKMGKVYCTALLLLSLSLNFHQNLFAFLHSLVLSGSCFLNSYFPWYSRLEWSYSVVTEMETNCIILKLHCLFVFFSFLIYTCRERDTESRMAVVRVWGSYICVINMHIYIYKCILVFVNPLIDFYIYHFIIHIIFIIYIFTEYVYWNYTYKYMLILVNPLIDFGSFLVVSFGVSILHYL